MYVVLKQIGDRANERRDVDKAHSYSLGVNFKLDINEKKIALVNQILLFI